MKVGFYSPYFDIYGGGERYILSAVEFFLKNEHQVDIFCDDKLSKKIVQERFNIDINDANLLKNKVSTFSYDLFFFLSDGSIPLSFAKRNILHFQHPFNYSGQKTFWNKFKLSRFDKILCNSKFTKKFIDKTYGINSEVLYPPVDIKNFFRGKKENIILSVGRFFSPSHPKKQEILIDNFKKMNLKNWQLVLIGGGRPGEINKLSGENIKIIVNSSFAVLQNYYSKAKIFWHATGFGEDLEKFPQKAEHFGITTVEAMTTGCVPIVFAGGGQLEIITDRKNGFFWETKEELTTRTLEVIKNPDLWEKISAEAEGRAQDFSKEKFNQCLKNYCLG